MGRGTGEILWEELWKEGISRRQFLGLCAAVIAAPLGGCLWARQEISPGQDNRLNLGRTGDCWADYTGKTDEKLFCRAFSPVGVFQHWPAAVMLFGAARAIAVPVGQTSLEIFPSSAQAANFGRFIAFTLDSARLTVALPVILAAAVPTAGMFGTIKTAVEGEQPIGLAFCDPEGNVWQEVTQTAFPFRRLVQRVKEPAVNPANIRRETKRAIENWRTSELNNLPTSCGQPQDTARRYFAGWFLQDLLSNMNQSGNDVLLNVLASAVQAAADAATKLKTGGCWDRREPTRIAGKNEELKYSLKQVLQALRERKPFFGENRATEKLEGLMKKALNAVDTHNQYAGRIPEQMIKYNLPEPLRNSLLKGYEGLIRNGEITTQTTFSQLIRALFTPERLTDLAKADPRLPLKIMISFVSSVVG